MTKPETSLEHAVRRAGPTPQQENFSVDMFSAQGFSLAQRVATALASSNAVPSTFRRWQLKGNDWVENPSAIGNCLIAIDVAQSIGMSVTAVMQNADCIEGKLRWSDRFVVACVNASRRFTPLRFDIKNRGEITASYREKTGWDDKARKAVFVNKDVTLENFEAVAWALPYGFAMPSGVYTLDQARKAGLPVIEGPPISMKLAVEEGWYSKPGSKWQTELKHKMLMMRSGRYFGDAHAPDVVMGIGRTTEEEFDVLDAAPDGHGVFTVEPTVGLKQAMAGQTMAMEPPTTEQHHPEPVESITASRQQEAPRQYDLA
jgi:hypothetical protein